MEGLLGQAISLSLIFTFFPLLSALPRGVTLTTQPYIHEHKNFPHLPYPLASSYDPPLTGERPSPPRLGVLITGYGSNGSVSDAFRGRQLYDW